MPRAHPSCTLRYAYSIRSGSKGPFRFPGATWDRLHCTVEPSPGHIRCRKFLEFPNVVVLNAVVRRNTQMRAKERKRKAAKERKRAKLPFSKLPCSFSPKKELKPKLLGPDIFQWGGALPHEWVGAKSSVCPRNPGKPNFWAGYSGIFAGISRGRPKSLRKKVRVQNFGP